MNKIKSKIVAAFLLTAAATIGPLSTPAQAKVPTPTVPCAKWVADNNISGRNGVSVRDNAGVTHVIKKGYRQYFCPVSMYIHSGYDGYAESGSAYSNYYATGWHTFKSSLCCNNLSQTLYVFEY
jgi:hypothetical protein